MNSKRFIDRLKAILYLVYIFSKAHRDGIFRWRAKVKGDTAVRVYYGHDHIPLVGEHASGGIIKCQDLQESYPNTLEGANVMYLVSSSLPPCPEILVRYAKRNGAKLIVNQNGVAFPAYHGNNLEKMNGIRRSLLQQADYVIYQSAYCKVSSDKYLTDKVKNFSIMHNPVDVGFFKMRQMNPVSSRPILLMAGSVGYFYRIASGISLISALKKFGVDVELKIYGRLAWKDDSNQCIKEIQTLSSEYGVEDSVTIGQPYSQVEAPSIYQGADLLIHTQYNDACPRTVVEAMACGLPVVYSKSGGVPELVGDDAGIGISVPRDWMNIHSPDPELMAQAVIDVLATQNKFSEAARRRAELYFDVRPWVTKHQEIFDSVVRCNA